MKILNRYTLNSLKRNKSRTMITVVGIALSLAMITSVTILVSSSQDFLRRSVIRVYGSWHAAILGADETVRQDMLANGDIGEIYTFETIGYAMPKNEEENPPFLYLMGGDVNNLDVLAMPFVEGSGRLPENENEILLPDSYNRYNWENPLKVGDTVTLDIGMRMLDGEKLTVYNPVTEGETFEIYEQRTFTITGIYKNNSRQTMGNHRGFTVIAGGLTGGYPMDIFFTRRDVDKVNIFTVMDRYTVPPHNCGSTTNLNPINFSSGNLGRGYNPLLYGLESVLMAIIVFASVSLIYNAFSISVGERVRQFGLLSSIGATRRQLTKSVIAEAAMLCIIGIPLGVLRGLVGIGVTLQFSGNLLDTGFGSLVFSGAENIPFTMSVSWPHMAGGVALGLATVLLSAWLPVRKAFRLSAIDSIRQSAFIRPEKYNVKVPFFVGKIFGFEGVMAVKNFRRSRHRYRATVFSLFTSIVLFIAAYSFCDNLARSAGIPYRGNDYDIDYLHMPSDYENRTQEKLDELFEIFMNMPEVTGGVYTASERQECYTALDNVKHCIDFVHAWQEDRETTKDSTAVAYAEEAVIPPAENQALVLPLILYLNDSEYDKWLEENKLEKFTKDGRYIAYTNSAYENVRFVEKGQTIDFQHGNTNPKSIEVRYRDDIPYVDFPQHSNVLYMLMPYSFYENDNPDRAYVTMRFYSSDPGKTEDDIRYILKTNGIDKYPQVLNLYEENRTNRAILAMINLFTFGFITLITLIAAANAFNTVSTNISLRRRELAVFTATGMSEKQKRRMLAGECAICGLWAVATGIPAGLIASRLVYKGVYWMADYVMPFNSLWISVVIVFAVMYATMLYTLHRVNKHNIIETLKNENA